MQQAEYEAGMEEAEEAFAAKQALEFAAWSKDEETKGRPKRGLTFENFVRETDDGEGN